MLLSIAGVQGRGFIIAVLLSSLAVLASASAARSDTEPDGLPTPLAADQIESKIEQLTAEFRDVDLLANRGVKIRDAIASGDFTGADRLLDQIVTGSDPKTSTFSTLSEAMERFHLAAPGYEARLDGWIAADGKSAWPWILKARYDYSSAWSARGNGFAKDVGDAAMSEFERDTARALNEVDQAIERDDRDPYSRELKLKILQGAGLSSDFQNAFSEAIARFPNYLPYYSVSLDALHPEWGGSIDEMYAFVDRFGGDAVAADSPMRLLYLDLYRGLIHTAGLPCTDVWSDTRRREACVDREMEKLVKPGLEDRLVEAFRLYDRMDKFQYTSWLNFNLNTLARCGCSPMLARGFLDLAAKTLHSRIEFAEGDDSDNNYVIDHAVANAWAGFGMTMFATKKDLEALKDLRRVNFPTLADKAKTVAALYASLSRDFGGYRRFPEMIAYEAASLALDGGNDSEQYICQGYFELKAYQKVQTACADSPLFDGLASRFWRGQADFASGKLDDAIREMDVVANSRNGLRLQAALTVSYIQLNLRKDYQGVVDVLTKYKDLYDRKVSTDSEIASAYSELCSAYMHLGRDRDALDNCRNALNYESFPDVYARTVALEARLGAKGGVAEPGAN